MFSSWSGVVLDSTSATFASRCVRSSKYAHYSFFSLESFRLWHCEIPLRMLDESLGFPILVCDEEGEYLRPASSTPLPEASGASRRVRDAIRSGKVGRVRSAPSGCHGLGVFAVQDFCPGDYVGPYGGKVMTDEEFEASKPDGQFMFVLHHGAQGVVVDGEIGPVNDLKYLNHSCEPNVRMIEVFEDGRWHVAVIALESIDAGCELTHDYGLTTEDPDDPALSIRCRCGSKRCRGRLVSLREW